MIRYLVPVISGLEVAVVIAKRCNRHKLTSAGDWSDQKARRVLTA